MVDNQINQLKEDSVGKSYERTVISSLAIFAEKWLKIAVRKKVICWSLPLIVDGSRSRSAAASYFA